jgi:uncharacterized membrane protein YjfL (UPF0719 family)
MNANFFERFVVMMVLGLLASGLLGLLARRASKAMNDAKRLRQVFQHVGAWWLVSSVVQQAYVGEEVRHELLWMVLFSSLGMVLYVLAGVVGVRVLLGRSLGAELDENNTAAGVAVGGHDMAMALILGVCMTGGDVWSIGLSLGFWLLGVLVQQALVALFRALTTYSDSEQIAGENMAAAISYAGISVGSALVVSRALEGEFEGWLTSLMGFFEVSALGLLLLVMRQLLVGGLWAGKMPRIRGGAHDQAIELRHDTSVALLDAATMVATAIVITRLVA